MATKKNDNGNGQQPKPPQFGIGRENAVAYFYPVGDKLIQVLRYLKPIKELKYDPENHRLESKLMREGKKITQALLEQMLHQEAEELLAGLRVSGGITEPALILSNNIVKEGNRRLAAFNRLSKGDQGHPADSRFDYMPVEELPQDIDKGDLQMMLAVRHVAGVKEWPSRERARAVMTLQKTERLTDEQVCALLGWDSKKLAEQIRTAILYDEYEIFVSKHKREEKFKEPPIDGMWSYFARIADKPKFLQILESVDGQKDRLFAFIHNGQIGDHVGLGKISSIWDKPDTMKMLDEGKSLKEAYSFQTRRWAQEREDKLWPNIKSVTTSLKKLPKKYIRTLNNADEADNLNKLKQLKHTVDGILLSLEANIPMPKKNPKADEEAA